MLLQELYLFLYFLDPSLEALFTGHENFAQDCVGGVSMSTNVEMIGIANPILNLVGVREVPDKTLAVNQIIGHHSCPGRFEQSVLDNRKSD